MVTDLAVALATEVGVQVAEGVTTTALAVAQYCIAEAVEAMGKIEVASLLSRLITVTAVEADEATVGGSCILRFRDLVIGPILVMDTEVVEAGSKW